MKKAVNLGLAVLLFSATSAFAGHWGYFGQEGIEYNPAQWGELNENCNGSSQSPIDILTRKTVSGDAKINFEYASKAVSSTNNGHAVTVSPKSRAIEIAGKKYTLAQFHFHTLSEHTVNGQHYDMEMHLVHADDAWLAGDTANGKLAVIGVFIERGAENLTLENIFKHLPHFDHATGTGETISAETASDFYSLLPSGRNSGDVYSYSGSLTTPTCNEVVSWYVLAKPIQMSEEQIEAYRALYENESDHSKYDTNRPVQPLNGRTVSFGKIIGEKK